MNQQEIQQKKKEVVFEFLKRVKEKGRAVTMDESDMETPHYIMGCGEDEKRCAVGMFIKDEFIGKMRDYIIGSLVNIYGFNLQEAIRDDLSELDLNFWCHLQDFHDNNAMWKLKGDTPNELSSNGISKLYFWFDITGDEYYERQAN